MEFQPKNQHHDTGIAVAKKFFEESVAKQMRESVTPIFQGLTDDHIAFDIYVGYASAMLTLMIADFTTALGPEAMDNVLRRAQAAGIIGGTISHLELRGKESEAEAAAAKTIKTAMSKG